MIYQKANNNPPNEATVSVHQRHPSQHKMLTSIKCWPAQNVHTQHSREEIRNVCSQQEKTTEWRHTPEHGFIISEHCRDMNKFRQMRIMIYLGIVTH